MSTSQEAKITQLYSRVIRLSKTKSRNEMAKILHVSYSRASTIVKTLKKNGIPVDPPSRYITGPNWEKLKRIWEANK